MNKQKSIGTTVMSSNVQDSETKSNSDMSVVLIDENDQDLSISPTSSNVDKNDEYDSNRFCWICLTPSEEDDDKANTEWIHPCHCSGTSKWVHQSCLQMWIDEKQKYNANMKVTCSQCDHEYVLIYPSGSFLFNCLEFCDQVFYSISPIIACTCMIGSLYWSAVCYGAFTILQVMGKENGRNMIEQSDPVSLLIGLPSIPVILIFSRWIRWEEHVLKLWLQNDFRLPLFGYSVLGKPKDKPKEYTEQALLRRNDIREPASMCRAFCGALVLPTCATLVGSFFFSGITSNLQRALLGGLTFVISKGFLKIILRQRQYIRQTHRKIINYQVEEKQTESTPSSTVTTS